jgi:pimeloyl-ACP methyl ester carboxylesterase
VTTSVRWAEQIVTLEAGTYSLRMSGSVGSPRAMMIHGLGGSSLNWFELMGSLDQDVTAVAVDLPGFGMSPPPRDGDYSPRGHARHVGELIDHLRGDDPTPWHIFGNSLGGLVSVFLAADRPDLVASLTLIAPAMPARRLRKGTAHMPVIAIPGVGERLVAKYLELPVERRVEDTVRSVYGEPGRMGAERRLMAEAEARSRDDLPYVADATLQSLRGLLATFFDATGQRPWRLAEQIRVPVLAVYGQRDQLVDAKAAHRITRHFADAHVVVLPDSGHVAMMEHPAEVAAAWRRFIKPGSA